LTNVLQGDCLDMLASFGSDVIVDVDLIPLSGKGAEFCQVPN
jgi:hypothetical protein